MRESGQIFEEACRMVGECCLMLAQNCEEVSRRRIVFCLERAQEEALDFHGEPNSALQLAIRHIKGL